MENETYICAFCGEVKELTEDIVIHGETEFTEKDWELVLAGKHPTHSLMCDECMMWFLTFTADDEGMPN